MANLRPALDQALFEALNTTTVLAAAPGGVYNSVAPAQVAGRAVNPPYIVFQSMSIVDDYSFNGRFATAVYLVKAVSRSPWPKEASDADTQIDTALQDATLTISGFSQLLCRRENAFSLVEERDGQVWQHVGGLYRVMVDQS